MQGADMCLDNLIKLQPEINIYQSKSQIYKGIKLNTVVVKQG